MRIIIDECLPQRLRLKLPGHDVRTVTHMGWSGKRNGELLRLMVQHGFEVLITADRSVRHQQNLHSLGIAAIVLLGVSNRLADLEPLMPAAGTALNSIKPGDVIEILR
jgi:hypothetical protein